MAWNSIIWGMHVYSIVFFFFVMFLVGGALTWYNREKIKERYIKFWWPEKVIEVCIHHPGSHLFTSYWRLIPRRGRFDIKDEIYRYDDLNMVREDVIADIKDGKYFAKIEGVERHLDLNLIQKKKQSIYPQIHYFENCPEPIDWNHYEHTGFKISGDKIKQVIKSDLWNKALDLSGQNAMIMICILMGGVNLVLSLVIISKLWGWIK